MTQQWFCDSKGGK